MIQRYVTSHLLTLLLLVSGCGGSTPSEDSSQRGPVAPDPILSGSPVNLAGLEFQGELPLEREQVVDISQMLQDADYGSPVLERVARDGSTLLISSTSKSVQTVDNVSSTQRGYIRIDTQSGDAEWVLTDVGIDTLIHFDENNNAVVAAPVGCSETSFIDVSGESPINFNSLIPNERCISGSILSDNGDVLVYRTFNRDFLINGRLIFDYKHFAYNLTSSSTVEYPATSVFFEGQLLEPTQPLISPLGLFPQLSNDGIYVSSSQCWQPAEYDSDSPSLIGSVIWNTQTNQWQTRGLAPGDRVGCDTDYPNYSQPFQYALSADGTVQYSQIPQDEVIDSTGFGSFYGSTMVRSLSTDANEGPIVGAKNAAGFAVNRDGSLLAFYATETSGDLATGLTLYDNNSGEYFSIDSAVPACSPNNSGGDDIHCDRVWNTYFSADSAYLLLANQVFPSDATTEYMLDLGAAALYAVPARFSVFQGRVSGDGTVFAVTSSGSDNAFLIGRR